MPSTLRLTLTLGALALAVACGGTTAKPTDPRIALSEDSYDFGQVAIGELRHHTFTISNAGGSALTMDKDVAVKVDQGC